MPPARPDSDEIQLDSGSRTRPPSIASSSRSGSSQNSWSRTRPGSQGSIPTSPKPSGHRKSNTFTKFFLGTKEPSLDSYKHLAELQQRELEKKGQKLPFGVPQAKIPETAKDDYKKAKQRAKEQAKMREAIKEKLKEHESEYRERQRRKDSLGEQESNKEDYFRPVTNSSTKPPKSPSSRTVPRSQRRPSLSVLPEVPIVEAAAPAVRELHAPQHEYSLFPVSAPPGSKPSPPQATSMLTGNSRKEALPWE